MPQTEPNSRHPVRSILVRLAQAGKADDVTIRTLIAATGTASLVPAMLVPALLVISPLSGIPLFSSVCGIAIALIAAQAMLGREGLWLPRFVIDRKIPGLRLRQALARIVPVADWLDRRIRPRFAFIARKPYSLLPATLAFICGAALPFLELVPLSSSMLGSAVVCFSLTILGRDGLFMLFGAGFIGIASIIPIVVVTRFD